jgi:DNA mismatch repair protein MutS2
MNEPKDTPPDPIAHRREPEAPVIASPATLAALEFDAALALYADEARTDLGRARLLAARPLADEAALVARREAYAECDRLRVEAPLVPSLGDELGEKLERAVTGEPALGGGEILLVARLLAAAGEAARRIRSAEPACPRLVRLAEPFGDPRPLVAKIERLLDRKGEVRDDASPRLGALRREVQASREKIYDRLETIGGAHRELLGEETVPMRGGRLMLMLQSGARGRISGLVHGRSATGKSLYFEPLEVVEENNSLQSAVEEFDSERQRILHELLGEIAREAPLLEAAGELVAELDALESAARLAGEIGARLPDLAPRGRLRLAGARHPLLEPRLAGRRERALGSRGHDGAVVPLAVELGEATSGVSKERRILVVTGPNAGGKTVALKTVGLLALLAQSGLPVPVEAGSELPWLASIVATVGDEQDLLAERSTFSGRLARLSEAWSAASPASLALLDELGSGTDPEEGAALSVALVEELVARGGLGLITTHLSAVAAAAMELPGAACAAMEFEPSTGRPTFRLRPGAPGGSEALALARRMGLAADWIARAERLLGAEHRDLRRLLAELEQTREELALEAERERAAAAAARAEGERLERERAALEAERRSVAARLKRELEEFRARVQKALGDEASKMKSELESGRRRNLAGAAAARLFADAPTLEVEESDEARPLAVGGRVRHRTLGWRGELLKLDGARAEVAVSGKRLRAAAADLVVDVGAPAPAAPRRAAREREEERPQVAPELHLIGQRVEPALEELDDYLDRAVRAGRPEVRVVHGHGTGRLREAIREHLRRHASVANLRAGAPNEGGNGATVVTLA